MKIYDYEYFASDIETILNLKRNRLQAWISAGFIKPSIEVAEGPGTRNKWHLHDLYTLAMFKKITEAGMSRSLVSKILAEGGFSKTDKHTFLNKLRYRVIFLLGGEVKKAIVLAYKTDKPGEIDLSGLSQQFQVGKFDLALIIDLQDLFQEVNLAAKNWADSL